MKEKKHLIVIILIFLLCCTMFGIAYWSMNSMNRNALPKAENSEPPLSIDKVGSSNTPEDRQDTKDTDTSSRVSTQEGNSSIDNDQNREQTSSPEQKGNISSFESATNTPSWIRDPSKLDDASDSTVSSSPNDPDIPSTPVNPELPDTPSDTVTGYQPDNCENHRYELPFIPIN